MRNYIQPGNVLTLTAPANVSAGDVVQVGQIIGVAASDALSGAEVEVQIGGVFSLPKNTSEALTEGQLVWHDGTEIRNATAVGRLIVGYAVAAAGTADATAAILLDATARADD